MELTEFLTKLNTQNPYYEDFVRSLERLLGESKLVLLSKGPNLLHDIRVWQKEDRHPLVDKRFNTVFGLTEGAHGVIRTHLYRYFFYGHNPLDKYINPNDAQDRYISEGRGWFISSMQPHIIIAGEKYRPDKFDSLVFNDYTIETYAPSAAEIIARWKR